MEVPQRSFHSALEASQAVRKGCLENTCLFPWIPFPWGLRNLVKEIKGRMGFWISTARAGPMKAYLIGCLTRLFSSSDNASLQRTRDDSQRTMRGGHGNGGVIKGRKVDMI